MSAELIPLAGRLHLRGRHALCQRRPWRRFRLPGDDGPVQPGAGGAEADGPGAEYRRRRGRQLAVLTAKQFSWRVFWPFAITSIPASFLGGCFNLPPHLYRPALGVVLLFAAWRLLVRTERQRRGELSAGSAGGHGCRGGTRFCLRIDRRRRRDLPQPAHGPARLGAGARDLRGSPPCSSWSIRLPGCSATSAACSRCPTMPRCWRSWPWPAAPSARWAAAATCRCRRSSRPWRWCWWWPAGRWSWCEVNAIF